MNNFFCFLAIFLFINVCKFNAQAQEVQIDFKGTIIDKTCYFSPSNSGELIVTLPPKTVKYFEKYKRTLPISFDLKLENCSDLTIGKEAIFTFTSLHSQIVDGLTMLSTIGGTGIVLGLKDKDLNPIIFHKPITLGFMQSNNSTIFRLNIYALAPDLNILKEGPYESSVNFIVSYF